MKLYFDDEDFDGQLQRSVGKADSGMANVGECLAIAERITPGDRGSWFKQWSGFASGLARQGHTALTSGHRVSARGLLIRASEYYRQAFFYHQGRSRRRRTADRLWIECEGVPRRAAASGSPR